MLNWNFGIKQLLNATITFEAKNICLCVLVATKVLLFSVHPAVCIVHSQQLKYVKIGHTQTLAWFVMKRQAG